jgi:hypothetical protein
MSETETKWTERVRAWRSSGQAASQFAQGREFEASTLRYWASRLRKEAASTERESAPTVTRAPRVRLLRVTPAPAIAQEPLVVSVGAARIEVRAGFDCALLCELINALGGAR